MSKRIQSEVVPYRMLLPLLLGTMMNPLNSTMLATALLSLCNSFSVSVGEGAILITILYITSAIAQPLMGRLADLFNPKTINLLGFAFVFIASLIGAFAPYFSCLIGSRIILGLGTSAAYPSAIAILNKKYAADGLPVPGRVLGLVAISSQVSMVVGPVLGGLLTEWISWKGIFLINIPWILIALYATRYLPHLPKVKKRDGVRIIQKLDVPGMLLFSFFLLSFLYTLMQSGTLGISISLTVFFFISLLFWEWRQPYPFIDVRLLRQKPALFFTYLRTLLTNYVMYQVLFALPPWIEAIHHISPANTGLIVFPESAMAILMGFLVSKSNKLFKLNVFGVITLLLACGGWLLLGTSSGVVLIVIVGIVIGVADGVNMIANQALLNEESPLGSKGIAFGLYRTFGYIGAILASTQLKSLYGNGVTHAGFHHIGFLTLFAGGAMALLLIPLWQNKPVAPAIG